MRSHYPTFAFSILRAMLLLGIAVVVVDSQDVSGQASPADGSWSGQIQCQLDIQDSGHVRHETQTWTLTGEPPSGNGDIHIYPATWTAAGQGMRQMSQGLRTTNAQWNINVPSTSAPIAMFIRAQDGAFIIRQWHSQKSLPNGMAGTRQAFMNGSAEQPSAVSFPAFEWQLPWIITSPDSNLSGTLKVPVERLAGDLGLGVQPSTAVCKWQFSRGKPALRESGPNVPVSSSSHDAQMTSSAATGTASSNPIPLGAAGSFQPAQVGNPEGTAPLQSGGMTVVKDPGRMNSQSSSTTHCGTSAQGAISDQGSHTFSTARLLQVTPGPSIYWYGNLLSENDNNYFVVKSSTAISATVQLSGLDCGSDFDLYVFNDPGGPAVASSTVRGVSSKQVVVDLDGTGLYAVVRGVTWNSSSPSYHLKVTATTTTAGSSADATAESAAPVAVTSQGPAVHAAPDGTAPLQSGGMTAVKDPSRKNSLSSSTTHCGTSAQGAISDQGSHTFSTARLLQVIPGGNITWTGNLLSENDNNYFEVKSSTNVSATIQLSGLDCGSDFDLYVYRYPGGPVMASSTVRGVSSKQVVVDLDGTGLYAVVGGVTWTSASPGYQLKVTATTSGVH